MTDLEDDVDDEDVEDVEDVGIGNGLIGLELGLELLIGNTLDDGERVGRRVGPAEGE